MHPAMSAARPRHTAVHAATVHSATAVVTHATAAAAAAPHLRDQTFVQMSRKARTVENLDRFGLRQTKAAERHCDETRR
jgi:hypothetical protein